MPIFSPASPDTQVAPILQAHVAQIKSQIPSELQAVAPKANPTSLFNDYLNTGNQMFKQAAGTALNKLQEFATNSLQAMNPSANTVVNQHTYANQTPTPLQDTIFHATKDSAYANNSNLASILNAENKPQDPLAIRKNTDGSQDLGLFQINSKNIPDIQKKFAAQGQVFNPFNPNDSAKAAAMIFDENVKEASTILKRPLTDDEMLDAYNSPSDVVKAAREDEAAKKRQDTYVNRSQGS